MSGPIVRTGTTPEFWKNWDRAFGGGADAKAEGTKKSDGKKKAAEKADKKKAGKKKSK